MSRLAARDSPSDDDHVSTISHMSETSSTISRHRSPTKDFAIDQEEVLRHINQYRSEHGAGALKWSAACARRAQERANHRGGPSVDFGENLARSTSDRWSDPNEACIAAVHHWQNQELRYDYTKPGLSAKTNKFTNNVWKLTTHVGFGVGKARYKGKMTFFVVAFFFPRGNQPGDFGRNVLPKGSVYDGDENMVKLATTTTDAARAATASIPQFVRVSTVNTEIRHLRSANGRFQFQILPNRNIVVRQAERLIWQSGSKSNHSPPVSAPFRLVLQRNGDLVAYDSSSRGFWSTQTAGCGPAPYTLSMQDDGHCVLYDGGWVAHWATNASPSRKSDPNNSKTGTVSTDDENR